MKEFKYVITDPQGIHARPGGELVKAVKAFKSTVKIDKDGKSADGRKLLALMGLGIKAGQEITVTIEGEDEEAACEGIAKFLKENL